MFIKSLSAFFLSLVLHSISYAKVDATIVYAADLPIVGTPAHGDYAELATLLANSRKSAKQTPQFFLFGGASLAPSPLASFDSGSHIVDILNLLEPDAMSVTKREFSYFEDELTLRSYEAAFPFLLSNAIDKQSGQQLDGIYSHLVVSKQGYSIGVISIIHPRVSEQYLLQRVVIQSPEKTVARLTEKMRLEGAELIVLLHSDHFPFIDQMLENSTLDLAIQSEPHDINLSAHSTERHPNRVLINKLGTAAVIQVKSIESNSSITVEIVELATQSPDSEVAATITSYKSRLERQLQRLIGKTATVFTTERKQIRTKENGFANLITDAMMTESQSQIALINSGVVRGNRTYTSGQTFLYGDLLDELPFRTRMVVLEVSGKQLMQALENGVSQLEGQKGRFPQVSGFSFTVSPHKPIGERISNLRIDNIAMQEDQVYTLATSDYLAKGGDGYTMLTNTNRRYDKSPTMPLISDVLARYLQKTKVVSPYVDGRIGMLGSGTE